VPDTLPVSGGGVVVLSGGSSLPFLGGTFSLIGTSATAGGREVSPHAITIASAKAMGKIGMGRRMTSGE